MLSLIPPFTLSAEQRVRPNGSVPKHKAPSVFFFFLIFFDKDLIFGVGFSAVSFPHGSYG